MGVSGEALRAKSVFVTGAHGLLGSWLVKRLVELGARTTVLRRDSVVVSALSIEGTEAKVNVVHGDLSDAALVERVVNEYEIDTVFHLAAQTIVGAANRSPVSTFESNVRGTWNVLEACRAGGVERVVVAASDKAYGVHDELPYREDFALRPLYPYDASKAAADMIARSYWHTYRVPVAVTRLANIYGGGDLNFSRLVPEAVSAALQGRPPVIRSDGTLERDWLYVEDAVNAYLAISDLLDAGKAAGEAFNAGSGRPHSVLEIVSLVCKAAATDVEPDVRGHGVPEGEIPRQYVDATKLRELAGWRAEVELEEGLRRTVAWYREHAEAQAPLPGP
jgi:CDP-glucose 4,6-dehydratase